MPSIEITSKEMFVADLALRIVLCDLLNQEQFMVDTVTAVAHNVSTDTFGAKEWKPENSNDWNQYVQPMRDLIAKLDPECARALLNEQIPKKDEP